MQPMIAAEPAAAATPILLIGPRHCGLFFTEGRSRWNPCCMTDQPAPRGAQRRRQNGQAPIAIRPVRSDLPVGETTAGAAVSVGYADRPRYHNRVRCMITLIIYLQHAVAAICLQP